MTFVIKLKKSPILLAKRATYVYTNYVKLKFKNPITIQREKQNVNEEGRLCQIITWQRYDYRWFDTTGPVTRTLIGR